MPSKKPYIQIRTTEEIIRKFEKISEKENRSMSNMGETIIKDFIDKFEKVNGKIDI